MSKEEINYEINNCITDIDTLITLDKRAMKDLENNTHEIGQQEVLTIIREFIRLKNDYNKEKEKNKELLSVLNKNGLDTIALVNDVNNNYISKDKIRKKIEEYQYLMRNPKEAKYYVAWYSRRIDILEELLEE